LYPKYIDKYFGDMKVTRKASTDLESSITEWFLELRVID
jgi:hypothetical protein